MKGITIFILLSILLCTGCEKDAILRPKKYPYVIMKEANTSEDGVEFIAEVINTGNSPVLSYGFVWSDIADPKLDESFSEQIDREIRTGEYSLEVTSDLTKDASFTVRPYIQTENLVVYGNSIFFTSHGYSLPELIYFEPRSGDSGDTVVLYGKNLSVSKSRIKVLIGSDETEVISTDFEAIKFIIPQHLSRSGEVPLYVTSGEHLLQSEELFSINGHRIVDFSPKEGIIGETEVEISGVEFGDAEVIVWFGECKAEILSASETKIVVRMPYAMPSGNTLIKVDINGKKAVSDSEFQAKSRWVKLNNFPGETRSNGSMTIVDNYGYLLCGTQNSANWDAGLKDFWRYSFSTDQWDQLQDFPGEKRERGIVFAINENIYFGFGLNGFLVLKDFWKFNTQTITWTRLKDFPENPKTNLIYFTLGNTGYFLNDNEEGTNNVWQYEPDLDSWTMLGKTYDVYSLDSRDAFFQSNEKAYIIPITFNPGNYILYEFEPENSNFLAPTGVTLPESIVGDRLPAFILDGQIYILGSESDFWKYDFITDKWTRQEDFPGGMRSGYNYFSKANIGYLLFGEPLGHSVASPEIWTYNPNKYK